jgi:tetratricopeptide (TPR) repeat protein
MQHQLTETRALATAGRLAAARERIETLLAATPPPPHALRAAALELLGRCQLGLLHNVEAMMSFGEAEQYYRMAALVEDAAYCSLLRVRRLLDDRLLREARELLTPGLKEALANNWPDLLSLGLEYLGVLCTHTKEYRKAAGLLEEALQRGDSRKLEWEALMLKLTLANCLRATGDNARALELQAEISADPRHLAVPRIQAYLLMHCGYDAFLAGRGGQARECFAQVVALGEEQHPCPNGLSWLYAMAVYNLGLLELQAGNLGEAQQLLRRADRHAREHGMNQLLTASLTALMIIHLQQGQPGEALRLMEDCQRFVRRFGDIETRLADYYFSLVYLANGDLDAAQVMWLYKLEVEPGPEMNMHFELMRRILDRLLQDGAAAAASLNPPALELARRWRGEIDHWLPAVPPGQP